MYGYVDSWLTNEQVVFILGCMIVHETIFWSYGLAFHLIRKYNWFEEYKLGNPPPDSLVKPMLLEVSFSHFVTQPIALWALYYVAKGLAFAMIWEDFFLYWGHRLLHQPPLYKWFHKTNVPAVSEYATLGEVLLDNVLPTIIGGCVAAYLFKWHLLTFWLWLGIRVSESCDSHCGYQLPFSPWCLFPSIQGGTARHEFHHSHNVGNFGSFFVFWDWLCGTDVAWKKYRAQQERLNEQKKNTNLRKRT